MMPSVFGPMFGPSLQTGLSRPFPILQRGQALVQAAVAGVFHRATRATYGRVEGLEGWLQALGVE